MYPSPAYGAGGSSAPAGYQQYHTQPPQDSSAASQQQQESQQSVASAASSAILTVRALRQSLLDSFQFIHENVTGTEAKQFARDLKVKVSDVQSRLE